MEISNATTDKESERREELTALPTAANRPIEGGLRVRREVVVHSVRTALAAMVSLVVARLFGLWQSKSARTYWHSVQGCWSSGYSAL